MTAVRLLPTHANAQSTNGRPLFLTALFPLQDDGRDKSEPQQSAATLQQQPEQPTVLEQQPATLEQQLLAVRYVTTKLEEVTAQSEQVAAQLEEVRAQIMAATTQLEEITEDSALVQELTTYFCDEQTPTSTPQEQETTDDLDHADWIRKLKEMRLTPPELRNDNDARRSQAENVAASHAGESFESAARAFHQRLLFRRNPIHQNVPPPPPTADRKDW